MDFCAVAPLLLRLIWVLSDALQVKKLSFSVKKGGGWRTAQNNPMVGAAKDPYSVIRSFDGRGNFIRNIINIKT